MKRSWRDWILVRVSLIPYEHDAHASKRKGVAIAVTPFFCLVFKRPTEKPVRFLALSRQLKPVASRASW